MIHKLQKVGDDYLLRIDASLAAQAGFSEDGAVEVLPVGDTLVVIAVPSPVDHSELHAIVKDASDRYARVLRRLAE